jgi:adenosine deaminase
MRWSTVTEIAKSLGLNLGPKPSLMRDSFLVTEQMKDLEAVLNKFLNAQKVLASEEILTRLAFEVCEDAFNDNVLLLELRFAPTFINDGHSSLTFEKIHNSLIKGVQMAEKKYGMAVGLIGILQRTKPIHEAQKVMDFFIDHKNDYIAVDLADNEEAADPKLFEPFFQKAKKAGLHVTIHSGEAPHAKAGQWMMDAIDLLGAERIGHGVQCIHHPEVMKILKTREIPLEICPLSNWLTQAFHQFEDHPLQKLLEAGVPFTLCSDDPGIFGSTLTDDYEIARRFHQLQFDDFKRANAMAFKKSFIPIEKKKPWEGVFI